MHNKLPAAATPAMTVQTSTPAPAESRTPTERLQVLKQLFDQKLITQEEYDRKKADIIKSM
jgi:flagellar motility protein MotE (MotC chaperone)